MEGWIKLHRQTIDSRVFVNEGLLKVWVWCLLRANHSQQWVDIKTGRGTTEVQVFPGQFIFGRKSAAKNLKMKPDTVYSRMKKLEKMENINMQNNTHYSVVTIINWDSYQKKESDDQHPIQHPTNTQVTTNQQPNNTDKNEENENKEKNEKKVHPFRNHLESKIIELNLLTCEKKIVEFYKYRMKMKKADQYQTEKGINGLIRNVIELQKSGLDVNDSLEYAMEKNWKSPELRYFNNQKPITKNQNNFDSFVDEAFEANRGNDDYR